MDATESVMLTIPPLRQLAPPLAFLRKRPAE
jgi:hypothetical protein